LKGKAPLLGLTSIGLASAILWGAVILCSKTLLYLPYLAFICLVSALFLWISVGFIFVKDFDIENHTRKKNRSLGYILPSVDIFLPSCGEDLEIIDNTYYYVSKLSLSYKGDIKVYSLDDSRRPQVKQLADKYGFSYISRPTPTT
jgi:cellulose synthase (UDP-forming)